MMKERIAATCVLVVITSIPLTLWLYQYVLLPSTYSTGERVFTITAVAEPSGAYTLEEINGLNYWWKQFAPMTLLLHVGDRVTLNLKSADATHQFYIPELGLAPVTVTPGKVATVSFTAEKEGTFQYFCTTMCGDCHSFMTGWIVVSLPGNPLDVPNPIVCPLCVADFERPAGTDMLELGQYLYQKLGCLGCHGWRGKGGIRNPNYAKKFVPAHNTTAEKLFLRTKEDADQFARWLAAAAGSQPHEEMPDIAMFNVVSSRYNALKRIAKSGSKPERLEKNGPEPPLWMPAWLYRLSDRELDAIILYFLSLKSWDDDGEPEGIDLLAG